MAILKRRHRTREKIDISDINTLDELKSICSDYLNVFPIDVRAIAKQLGLSVRVEPMEEQKSGYLKRFEDGWVIGVNSLHHPRRQKFTLAHELGHYILHRKTVGEVEDTTLFRADGYGEYGIEREANLFAAQLLMPSDEFKKVVDIKERKINDIAEYFGVSALAVKVRAQQT